MAKESLVDIGWRLAAFGKSVVQRKTFVVQKTREYVVTDDLGQRSVRKNPIDFRNPEILNGPFVADTEEKQCVTRIIIPKPTT
jgi:hypothetical protein